MDEHRRCRARSSRTGERCRKAAIRGGTVCGTHGGRAPQVRAAAERHHQEERARFLVQQLGIPVKTTPEEALLDQVCEAAGNVALLRDVVGELAPKTGIEMDSATGEIRSGIAGPTGSRARRYEAEPHVLVRMYNAERERLVRFAKACAEVGISERMVRLAERQGELIAGVFQRALDDPEWELSSDQREVGRQVIARHLRLLGSDESDD